MADTVKIIDPNNGGGTHYTSLDAWEDALGGTPTGNLTAAADNTIAIADCRCTGGTADTTPVVISGWTTDETHYIKVYTNATYRHSGTYPTGNKYRLEAGEGTVLYINEEYVWIDGLAVKITAGTTSSFGINVDSVSTGAIYISNNIIAGVISGSVNVNGILLNDTSPVIYVLNNIVYDMDGSSSSAVYGIRSYSVLTGYIYNNTCYNCYVGFIVTTTGTTTGKNNLSYGNASNDYQATFDTSSNNLSEDATSPDAAYQSKTIAFVNAAGKNFHLAATDTDAIGDGVDLSAVTFPDGTAFDDDIDGEARGATWDIGADQYVSGGAGPTLEVANIFNLYAKSPNFGG